MHLVIHSESQQHWLLARLAAQWEQGPERLPHILGWPPAVPGLPSCHACLHADQEEQDYWTLRDQGPFTHLACLQAYPSAAAGPAANGLGAYGGAASSAASAHAAPKVELRDPLASIDVRKLNEAYIQQRQAALLGSFLR